MEDLLLVDTFLEKATRTWKKLQEQKYSKLSIQPKPTCSDSKSNKVVEPAKANFYGFYCQVNGFR